MTLNSNALGEAFNHAGIASVVAAIVGIAMAALLDWSARQQPDAVVNDFQNRVIEGLLGGYVEGFLVSLIAGGLIAHV